jgi:hypothetical protein
MNRAHHLAFGPDGNLYVSDIYNNRILRFQGPGGSNPGQYMAVYATSYRPYMLAFGTIDNRLFVSGGEDHTIRRFQGPYETNPGTYIDDFVRNGDPGMYQPRGIAFGPDDHLYVMRWDNYVIRYDGTPASAVSFYSQTEPAPYPDTDLRVYSDCSGSLIEWQDDRDSSASNYSSIVTIPVSEGQTIYANWLNTHSSAPFPFQIQEFEDPILPAPVILAVTPGSGQLTVEVSNVTGAEQYRVYDQATGLFLGEFAAQGGATSTGLISGLTGATAYCVEATAVDVTWNFESVNSISSCATTDPGSSGHSCTDARGVNFTPLSNSADGAPEWWDFTLPAGDWVVTATSAPSGYTSGPPNTNLVVYGPSSCATVVASNNDCCGSAGPSAVTFAGTGSAT